MRERLIELLDDYMGNEFLKNDGLADHLLENGVIVPPCKVGDTVYDLQFCKKRFLPFIRKAKIKKIHCSNTSMMFLIDAELIDAKEKGIMKCFLFSDFGKTVFLTQEEAEEALKGGE